MRNFIKSFSEIRKYIRRGPSQEVVKVCPICLTNSLEVIPNVFLGLLSPPFYFCRRCEYKGPIFAELERNQYDNLDSLIESSSSSEV